MADDREERLRDCPDCRMSGPCVRHADNEGRPEGRPAFSTEAESEVDASLQGRQDDFAPCTSCAGRGHFRDSEDADIIDERNGGMFGMCRDCKGSGREPERCEHGIAPRCWVCYQREKLDEQARAEGEKAATDRIVEALRTAAARHDMTPGEAFILEVAAGRIEDGTI